MADSKNHTPLKTQEEVHQTKALITRLSSAILFRMMHACGGMLSIREDEVPANISYELMVVKDSDNMDRYVLRAGPWSNITLPKGNPDTAVKNAAKRAGLHLPGDK